MSIHDEYEKVSKENIEFDNELIHVDEDSKSSLDFNNLQMEKRLENL